MYVFVVLLFPLTKKSYQCTNIYYSSFDKENDYHKFLLVKVDFIINKAQQLTSKRGAGDNKQNAKSIELIPYSILSISER